LAAKRPRDGKGKNAYLRKRAALRRRVAREGLPCDWCGEPFDLTLPDTDRMGFTADHPQALANGGHMVNQDLAPFHFSCNAKKGDHAEVEIWEAT
jgi:HNH endonuclease